MANYTAANIDKWAAKIGKSLEETARSVAVDLSAKIIERTPVDTGRAKGNWQASINRAESGDISRTSGAAAMAEARSVAMMAGGNVFYLVNNLPYANRLEYGWSQQAPSGMVRITVREFDQAVRAAVSRNR